MVQRVVYRRRHSYNTRSNRVKKVKTPGMRLVVQYLGKHSKGVMAPHDSCDCGKRISGIPKLKAQHYRSLSRTQKRVSRAYGGALCAGCVRDRIMRAFLFEEFKINKRQKERKVKKN
jgi:large subunit ribosomal protein L34e